MGCIPRRTRARTLRARAHYDAYSQPQQVQQNQVADTAQQNPNVQPVIGAGLGRAAMGLSVGQGDIERML